MVPLENKRDFLFIFCCGLRSCAENFCRALRFTRRLRSFLRGASSAPAARNPLRTIAKSFLMRAHKALPQNCKFSGWLGLISSRAFERPERAWCPDVLKYVGEREAESRAKLCPLGQNERPCEKQAKTGPAKKQYICIGSPTRKILDYGVFLA